VVCSRVFCRLVYCFMNCVIFLLRRLVMFCYMSIWVSYWGFVLILMVGICRILVICVVMGVGIILSMIEKVLVFCRVYVFLMSWLFWLL